MLSHIWGIFSFTFFFSIHPRPCQIMPIMPKSAKFCKILQNCAKFCPFRPNLAKFGNRPGFWEEEQEEKICHMRKSLGPWPVRCHCLAPQSQSQTTRQGTDITDHLMLLRLFNYASSICHQRFFSLWFCHKWIVFKSANQSQPHFLLVCPSRAYNDLNYNLYHHDHYHRPCNGRFGMWKTNCHLSVTWFAYIHACLFSF